MTSYSRAVLLRSTLALMLVLAAAPAGAQIIKKPEPAPAEPASSAITLPVNRQSAQVLAAAEELLKEKDWKKAIPAIQSILDAPEDSFVSISRPGGDGKPVTRIVAARSEAARLLQTMPEAGRAEYQKSVGEDAATRLAQAKQLGDPALLADVARRYFLTASGPEAVTLLATHYLNRDEPLMASLYFDRLFERIPTEQSSPLTLYRAALAFTRAGDKEKGEGLWKLAARKLEKDGGLKIDKDFLPLKKLRDELDRAGQAKPASTFDWPVFRGGATRTEQGNGGAPFLEATWTQSTICDTKADVKKWTDDNIKQAQTWLDQRGQPALPAFFPIAVKDKVIYRTYDGLYAAELKKEGKLAWYSYTDGGLFSLLTDPNRKAYIEQWNQFYRQHGPMTAIFENSVTGSLSTDGTRVYAVDDLALPPHPYLLRNFAFGGAQPNFGSLTEMVNRNSLKAYNLEAGKLVWELGGRFDKDDPATGLKASEFAGSFTLAPPLPLAGKLYVLTERNQELRLVCVEPIDTRERPAAPKVLWTQTLALTKDKLLFDFQRRTHAAHLAYGNGILICPTNAGAIVGVDLLTHELRWVHSYRTGAGRADNGGMVFPGGRFGGIQQAQINLNSEWRVAAPAISDGKVVFTAPDASHIHCLDLRDGSLLWKVPRAAEDLYFAGVFHGKALIIGKSYAKAFNLADGKPAWHIADIGMPSGQGTASEGVYYLPLKAGPDKEPEVCAISMAQGKVVARVKSRKKETPGNLIFHDGEVISQTLNGISSYPQVQKKLNQIDERLKQNPKDPAGLIERGELRLDRGDLAGALADLQTAIQNKPAAQLLPKARQKLHETLTEMLERDFASGEKHLAEYKALSQVDDTAQRQRREQTYFVLLAKGRESQGRLTDALQAYLDFASVTSTGELISVIDEPNTKARPDVWTRGRITALLAKATPGQRKELEEKIAERYKAVAGKNDMDSLRGFVGVFDIASTHGRQARLQLAQKLMAQAKNDKADELREAQLLLLQLRGGKEADASMAGQAVEVLAKLMLQKGLIADAAHYYKELGRDFAKIIIRDNKTGADIYKEIITDKRFQPFLEGAKAPWEGKFKVTELFGNFQMQPSFTLEPVGELTPFVQNLRIALELNVQQLRAIDKTTGADRWKSPALPSLQYLQHGYPNGRTVYTVQGSVMTVNLGHMVYAFDLLDGKKLWEHNLYAPGTNQNPQLGQVVRDREGNLQLLYQDGWFLKLGQSGPVTPDVVCIQTRTGLTALDPLKGTVLWTRNDVNGGKAHIFGDRDHIFLADVTTDSLVAPSVRAIRTVDGVAITVPDFAEAFGKRLRIVGRSLLVRDATEKNTRLRLYDPLTGKNTWQMDLAAESIMLKTDHDIAGIVEPDGTLLLVDLHTRKELLNTLLKKELLDKVNEGHLLADREQFYLVLNKATDPNLVTGVWMNVFHGMRCLPVNGTVAAIHRDGKLLWNNPVSSQMLVMEQFADLPLLLFTARTNEWIGQGANRINMHVVNARSIAKHNGKLLYDKQLNANINNFHSIMVNPQTGTVDLVSFNLKITHSLEKRDGK